MMKQSNASLPCLDSLLFCIYLLDLYAFLPEGNPRQKVGHEGGKDVTHIVTYKAVSEGGTHKVA